MIWTEALAEAPRASVAVKVGTTTWPAWLSTGVKVKTPVPGLNEELGGRLLAERVTASPSGSLAVTVKDNVLPTWTSWGPGTLMTGGRFCGGGSGESTVICTCRDAEAPRESVAVKFTVKVCPACDCDGVKLKRPLAGFPLV